MEHPELRRVLKTVTEQLLPAYPVIRAGLPLWVPREQLTSDERALISKVLRELADEEMFQAIVEEQRVCEERDRR